MGVNTITHNVARAVRGRLRDASGSNLVEAALITPLLVLLTLSIVDFGGLFYVYLALENGVSESTRFAITGNAMLDSSGTAMSREESIKTAMRRATPTLTLDDGAFSFSHKGMSDSSWSGGSGGPGDLEKVTVTYTWSLMTPLVRAVFPNGQITLHVDSAMKNEGRFQ